ncbi:MAG: DNA polymerase I [Armatimonadetes bacterium]|nr:DNA polymerase I [Armatimonadota bacterium]
MPKLIILDGNSLLYRGFFAMRALTTSDRLPTNAVYSFVLMLLTILEREQPDAIFAAFDPPVATFRHQELSTYKGTRQAMPDDLKPQRGLARDAARAFRVPVVEVEGYEADDVCGTLAEQGKGRGYEVLIVTGDGDALQLVDDGSPLEGRGPVRVMITVKGVTDTITYDERAVKERYGLSPAQIPDFKGLKGDASDNLPGVPGIGEKGASKLLKEYGTLENLIYHVDELPDKVKNALIAHTDTAEQCKRLATIVRDVPLPEWVDLTPDHQTVGPDFEAIRELFERLEFRTLIKRLPALERAQREKSAPPAPNSGGAGRAGTAPTPPGSGAEGQPLVPHEVITSQEQMQALLSRLGDGDAPVGLQLHASPPEGVKPAAMTLMNAALNGLALALPDRAYYAAWPGCRDALVAFLEGDRPKAVYDLKFASGALGRHGVTLNGTVFDALLAAYLLNAGRSGYPLADLAADSAGMEVLPDPQDPPAAAMDEAAAVYALDGALRPRLERDGLLGLHDDMELPLAPILARMERAGVTVDARLLGQVSRDMGRQVAALEAEIFALAGVEPFAIGSTKQLQEVLFDRLKLPVGKKTKTGYSTGAEVLEDLAAKGYEIATKIIAWRELTKLKSTYADAIPALINRDTGKVHTSLNQTVASTGRLSSSNPNLQNIPVRTAVGREIRKAFIASPGNVLVSADYSQIELRLFAHITKDPGLVDAFATGKDVHEETARRIFEIPEDQPVPPDQRRQAKTINFAVIYGASPFRVAAELGISQARAAELIKAYLALYPGVRKYLEGVLEGARERGYVQTLLGRRRYVPDVNSRVFQFRQAAEREAANMPVQGTSADIIKLAMLRVDKALADSGLSAQMILQVHDELLFECPPPEVARLSRLVRDAMEHAYPLDVPLRAEVKSGHNWWDVTPVLDEDAELRLRQT